MWLDFMRIPSYLNPIQVEVRSKLVKFQGNNIIFGEDHLRYFNNLIDDFQIEGEYVLIKLFIKYLDRIAKELYKVLPNASIDSWAKF